MSPSPNPNRFILEIFAGLGCYHHSRQAKTNHGLINNHLSHLRISQYVLHLNYQVILRCIRWLLIDILLKMGMIQ